jgi:hypothetical protein
MYDGVTASRLPTAATMVAGYVDGRYRWSAADWNRFPHAVKVRMAVFSSTDDGHVLDVEPGNATPAQSVDWVLMRRRSGLDPSVYMNASTWDSVRAAFRARAVPEPHYWVAHFDNVAAIPAGAVAKQYYSNDSLGYDLSVVADYWPGVDPRPVTTLKEPEMILNRISDSVEVWALSGSLYWHVADIQSLSAYKKAGVPEIMISPAEHQSILNAVAADASTAAAAATNESGSV